MHRVPYKYCSPAPAARDNPTAAAAHTSDCIHTLKSKINSSPWSECTLYTYEGSTYPIFTYAASMPH